MNVMLDVNVIMDALQERQPFDTEAKEIMLRAQNGEYSCYFTASAATDVFYLYRKARGLQSAKKALDFLLKTYGVASVTHEDCIKAISSSIDDFEDALVTVCAKKAGVDYVISRDDEYLNANSVVKVIKPKEFLKILTETD